MDINEVIRKELSKNKQMNTFVGGMDTDTADMYIKDTQYRYAENVRVITESDNNSGELRTIEGTTVLPFNCIIKTKDVEQTTYIPNCEIIALESIRDIAILITKELYDGKYGWSVYKFVGDDALNRRADQPAHAYRIVGPIFNNPNDPESENLLWRDSDLTANALNKKNISVVLRYENDNNIKAYIADGIHQTMVLQVAQNDYQGNTFSKLFEYQEQVLLPPTVQWSSSPGSIVGPVVQYAYRMYKKAGQPSTLSMISDALVNYKNGMNGYAPDVPGERAVKITIPALQSEGENYIQVFRIEYQRMAQTPVINLIYDNKYIGASIYDYGANIEEISNDEFLSYELLKTKPKQLESKGDYLFSANVKYVTDEVDEKFKDFDARCYTSVTKKTDVDGPLVLSNLSTLDLPVECEFYHPELTNVNSKYNPSNWIADTTRKYNGLGKTLAWKYTYKTYTVDSEEGLIEREGKDYEDSCRTYRRGDIYRFGIILYDKHGNKSSVKWIADIKMPDSNLSNMDFGVNSPSDFNIKSMIENIENSDGKVKYQWKQNDIGIEFIPINIDQYWQDVYGYEIVQCPRTIDDKRVLFQGISGFPLLTNIGGQQPLTHPAFLTPCAQYYSYSAPDYTYTPSFPNETLTHPAWAKQMTGSAVIHTSVTYANDVILFACPEMSLQKDDVKSVLDEKLSSIRLDYVNVYNSYTALDENGDPKHNPGLSGTYRYLFGRFLDPQNTSTENGRRSTGNDAIDIVYHSPILNGMQRYENCLEYGASPVYSHLTDGTQVSTWENAYNFDPPVIDYLIRWQYNSQMAYNGTDSSDTSSVGYYLKWYPKRSIESFSMGGLQAGVGATEFANRYAFIIPSSLYTSYKNNPIPEEDLKQHGISAVQYVESPSPTSFGSYNSYYSANTRTQVGSVQYINWHAPTQYTLGVGSATNAAVISVSNMYLHFYAAGTSYGETANLIAQPNDIGDYTNSNILLSASQHPIGAGGSLILFQTNDQYKQMDIPSGASMPPIWIQNVINSSVQPYGGHNYSAITRSTYIDTPATVKREDNNSTIDSVKCFYGDCYCKPFIYYATHYWRNYDVELNKLAVTYVVPIETEIDLRGIASKYLSPTKDNKYSIHLQDQPVTIGSYNQTESPYIYNTAYGVTPNLFTRIPQDNNVQSNNYDVRVLYSLNKTNGEYIDSWSVTKPADFLDVDSRYGSINMLKLYKDKLLFWQDHATGVLSVNERTIIKDEDSNAIQLGSGSVLERFDYFTTLYGMKPEQRAVAVTDGAVYWWDGYQKEILNHVDGYTITPLSTVKNVKNYIKFVDGNDTEESTIPTIVYDNKYKEVLFNVVEDKSLVYSEHTMNFTSVYNFSPIFYCNLDNLTIVMPKNITSKNASTSKFYQYNTTIDRKAKLFDKKVYPAVKYVVNDANMYQKVFDNQMFGGRFYQGDVRYLTFEFDTPLMQHSLQRGDTQTTDREYDYRLAIPRNGADEEHEVEYGDRMRGKTMVCEIKSDNNDLDFSLQYVITKYRISWT